MWVIYRPTILFTNAHSTLPTLATGSRISTGCFCAKTNPANIASEAVGSGPECARPDIAQLFGQLQSDFLALLRYQRKRSYYGISANGKRTPHRELPKPVHPISRSARRASQSSARATATAVFPEHACF